MLQLPTSWQSNIWEEFQKSYMKNIASFICQETKTWKTIYPKVEDIFNALKYTNFKDAKVVILGQDPYHGAWQAHGLSFSVLDWVNIPPSLRNIYKELENECFLKYKDWWRSNDVSGNLEHWAKQWVLLLNSVLTVEVWKPASHSKIWWQKFTDTIIKTISKEKEWVVFLLWWAYAIGKQEFIDEEKHLVLTSPHPSPFSAYKWFHWNNHFIKCNSYLEEKWDSKIEW